MRKGEKEGENKEMTSFFSNLTIKLVRKMDRMTILKTESNLVDQNEKSQA